MLSIPFRLAISFLVIAIAMPLCMQSIQDGMLQLSKEIIEGVAGELSHMAWEVSHRPVGESRTLQIADRLKLIESGFMIVAGGMPGDTQAGIIRCIGPGGWMTTVLPDLPHSIIGICSEEEREFVISRDTGNLFVSHHLGDSGHIVVVGAA